MDRVFRKAVEVQIAARHGSAFQDFMNYLYTVVHGTNFTPIRGVHDKGCDGLLERERTSLAVYAPDRFELASFKRKVAHDYQQYQTYWAVQYPHWQFVYNGHPPPEAVNFLHELDPNVEIVAFTHVMKVVDGLSWSEKRDLARFVGVDEQYLINNVLVSILEDLLARVDGHAELPLYQAPLYVVDKIGLNYEAEAIDAAISQQVECTAYFGVLQRLLAGRTDTEITALKSKVMADYLVLAGSFPMRLNHLTASYAGVYASDDTYVLFVRVVLLFLFEQCLIGRRTEGEE